MPPTGQLDHVGQVAVTQLERAEHQQLAERLQLDFVGLGPGRYLPGS